MPSLNFFPTTGITSGAAEPLTLEKIKRAIASVESMEKMRQGNWILVAPDGRMWKDPDPQAIAMALAIESLKNSPLNFPIVSEWYNHLEEFKGDQNGNYDPCI